MPSKARPHIPTIVGSTPAEVASEPGEGRKARKIPPCDGMTDLFYGDEPDLRDEVGREEREEVAKTVCKEECVFRFSCLQYALLNNQSQGVWGGMSPGDRRNFKVWLRRQGYRELPSGAELRLNVNIWEGDDGARPVVARNRPRSVDERHRAVEVPADEASERVAEAR